MNHLRLLCLFGAMTCGIACSGGGGNSGGGFGGTGGGGGSGGGTGANRWTIFVYGHADHNLSNSLVADMSEMSRAKLGPNLQVIVLADWDASAKEANSGQQFPTGSEWYRIKGNAEPPEKFGGEPEQNLDDPGVLSAAIKRAFSENPADRYGLIMWDHGGAWDHGFGSDSQNGTTQGTGIPVPVLATAIRDGLTQAGITGSQPLQFLSFDTCLMGTAEVAYALKDIAKVYIANAEIDYGDGWNYEDTLTYLGQNPAVDPFELAKQENQFWTAQHLKAGVDDKLLRAHAAFDPTKLDALAQSSASLAAAFASDPNAAQPVARAAYFSLPAYSATFGQGQNEPAYRDFGQMLNSLASTGGPVAQSAAATRDALQNAIIASSLGELRSGQLGMQIALPQIQTITQPWLGEYTSKAAAWNNVAHYSDILGGLAGQMDQESPTLQKSIQNAENPDATHLPTISFQIGDPDVAAVELNLGLKDPNDPNKLAMLGLVTTGAVEPAATYDMFWSGKLATVGTDPQYASVFQWMSLGTDLKTGSQTPPVLAIPGAIVAGAETAEAYLVFQDGDAQASTLIVMENGQASAFNVGDLAKQAPGVTFVPVLAVLDLQNPNSASLEQGTPFPLPLEGSVPIGVASAPAGEYVLLTFATDVWGNQSTSADPVLLSAPF